MELPGIGKILADKITTIVRTGALPQLEKLKQRAPEGLADLMELPGLGAKRVGVLYHVLGIENVDELDRAIRAGVACGAPEWRGVCIQFVPPPATERLAPGVELVGVGCITPVGSRRLLRALFAVTLATPWSEGEIHA